jgi:transposase
MDLAKLHLHWRVSQHNGKSYRSYSLARAYREDGKNRKEIMLKLGKLSEQEVIHWRDFLQTAKDPNTFITTANDVEVNKHLAYLDVATVSAIWDEWQLDTVFPYHRDKDIQTAIIARMLAINRTTVPKSKSQTPSWCQNTALPWILNFAPTSINAARIFRELSCIEEQKEALCKHLFALLQHQDSQAMSTVFYDLSSTTFTGSKCTLMKWGHCKEGYKNHIVLAIVVNRDGLPFYWEVLPGGTADATTITWLLDRLKERFKVASTTVVFDRGMVSEDNLLLLEEAKVKYISAMDKNQIEKITGINFTSSFSHLDCDTITEQMKTLPDFTRLNESTYYREIKIEGNRRYVLCFNPQLFADQRKAREQAIEAFKEFLDTLNEELRNVRRDRTKQCTLNKFNQQIEKKGLNGFVDVNLTYLSLSLQDKKGCYYAVASYQGAIILDEEKKRHAARLDGFWLLVSNHNEKFNDDFLLSSADAIKPYHDKVVIESAFRDIKSFVEIAPVYVWTALHVKAHFTICVLAYLINRTITLRLHQNLGKETHDIVAHERCYEQLSSCQIDHIHIKNRNITFYQMTRPTEKQTELLERLHLQSLLECRVIKQMNRRPIMLGEQ